jgi:crotonobetainyl-CoA:carnitine CoA-transferase CaiB-like acyl-CoA transferase
VEAVLGPAVARLPAAELLRRLEAAQIAYGSVREVGQVVSHPQLAARWTAVSAEGRPVRVLAPPADHSGFGPVLRPVPRHGEHTDAVLAELAAGGERAGRHAPGPGAA